MPTDVIMPQMGESIFEGTITKWLKKPGDTVQRDEPLFEISTDKVDAEIPSPASGVLTEVKIAEGNTVQINTVVGVIGDAEGQAAAPAPVAKVPSAEATDPPSAINSPAPAAPAEVAPPASLSDVIMPQMGESIFEGTITKWLKKPGDAVQQDEPLFEISTDKVDAEIPSPAAGTLSEIKVQAGATVKINTVVAVISAGGASTAAPAPARSAPPVPPQPPAAVEAAPEAETETSQEETGERVRSSPLVRRIARENNLDLRQVSGTGSAGRITKEDILGFLAKGAPAAKPAAAPALPPLLPRFRPLSNPQRRLLRWSRLGINWCL